MRVLVTGMGGFMGRHLSELLLKKPGLEIFGLERRQLRSTNKRLKTYRCDIRDEAAVKRLIRRLKPERVFHLAAQSFVPASWGQPEETLTVNVIGQLNLLGALRGLKKVPRILVAGSSDEYGRVAPRDLPIRESCALTPVSPYGVSKVAQDLLGKSYFENYGMPVVRTRAFSHIGPGQREEFAASNFARQIALIEAGRQTPVLHTGNLQSMRDFTDVRDMAAAYWLALEKGLPGEVYNISSGRGRRVGEIVDFFMKESRVRVRIKKDPSRARASDIPAFIGDSSKFRRQTGWKPLRSWESTLRDILDDWRMKIGVKKGR